MYSYEVQDTKKQR